MKKKTKEERRAEVDETVQEIVGAFQDPTTLPDKLATVFLDLGDTHCSKYSWSNQLIVAIRGYSDAMGFRAWKELDRFVKKGEKGFQILAPIVFSKEDDNGEKTSFVGGFRTVTVFGYEQTDGEEIPGREESRKFIETLPVVEVARKWGLNVQAFNAEGTGYAGYYQHGSDGDKAIAVGVKNLSTWAHELIHAADDKCGTLTKKPGQQWDNEIVAELGGAWEYIAAYAGSEKIEPVRACEKVLKRICESVKLVLDVAERLEAEKAEEVAELV